MPKKQPNSGLCRTDLACEDDIAATPSCGDGWTFSERRQGAVCVSTLKIQSDAAAARLGRARGSYVTITRADMWELDDDQADELVGVISGELRELARSASGREITGELGVHVVGLGNRSMTPDAVGPLTVGRVAVNRHLRAGSGGERRLFESLGCCTISASAPGVLGQTGIETAEQIRGAVSAATPDILVVVDALAARSVDRLAATVQLSDTGISPGSGIGNNRGEISRKTLGVPVISVGVPTVVDSSTLIWDALERAGVKSGEIGEPLRRVMENGRSFFVAPKECDLITSEVAALLGRAINEAFRVSYPGVPANNNSSGK